jgi:hypothetical protein
MPHTSESVLQGRCDVRGLDVHGPHEDSVRSKLYEIGLGRAHKGRPVKLLIADRNIRVIDLQGQLIRELTLDPTHNYQPLAQP